MPTNHVLILAPNKISPWLVAAYVVLRELSKKRARGRRRTGTIAGKAYVTDGDGIRVSGQEVRFAGLDAPEWDQVAKHRDGYWFRHGNRVKSALIREIGGKYVPDYPRSSSGSPTAGKAPRGP